MNLKILSGIILYYSLLTIFFWSGVDTLTGYTNTGNLSTIDVAINDTESPTIFQSVGNFGRFTAFITFGVGLPGDVPSWFQFIFTVWSIGMDIFVAGFIIASIWNG